MLEVHPHLPSHQRSLVGLQISTDKKPNESILLLTQPLVLSGVERPGVSALLRLSQLIRPKLTTNLHNTARYCRTHPNTVATEQAARLLAAVSRLKLLNHWQLPCSGSLLTSKENGLGLAFSRGWSESGPRHIYGLLSEPWMRHLIKGRS